MKKYNCIPFAFLMGIVFLVAGCGGGGTTTDPDGEPTSSDEATPERGDWIRIYNPSDPDALHPYATTHATATYVKGEIYQYLYVINPRTLDYEPVLVKEMGKPSEDGLEFTFEMRDEAVWDDGSPITGHDYAFSIKAIRHPQAEAQHIRLYYTFIKDVRVDEANPKKFTIVTSEPFFLAPLAVGGIEVLSKDHYDPKGLLDDIPVEDFWDDAKEDQLRDDPRVQEFSEYFHDEKFKRSPEHIYGSGAYKLESWTTGDNITLVRKKDWWGDKLLGQSWGFKAFADKIIFKTITDRNTAVQALKAGEIDVIRDVPGEDFLELKDDEYIKKNYNLHTPDTYSYIYLGLNGRPPSDRTPFFTDKRVRRALAHLADIDRMIEVVYSGFGTRIIGPISPHNKNEYHPGLDFIKFDPEKAKQLLDEAGWVDSNNNGIRDKEIKGKRVEFEIDFNVSTSSSTAPRLARMLASEAEKAGIKINVNRIAFGVLTDALRSHQFDMFGAGFNGAPLPKDLYQVWHSESWVNRGSNFSGFGNQETDSLIRAIRNEIDADKRRPMYHKIQEIIYDWQPMIFIMAPQERIAIHKRFRDAEPTTVRPGYMVSEFWVPKAQQMFGK